VLFAAGVMALAESNAMGVEVLQKPATVADINRIAQKTLTEKQSLVLRRR
jgi:hypothetical protein